MKRPPSHRALALGTVLAAAAVAGSGHTVAAVAPPPTLPPGYVQLVDDTGRITVAVPDTWTDVDTAPAADASGTVPYIAAAPDIASFQGSFDVPGVLYLALPFDADHQALIDRFGLPSGCQALEVVPYDDGLFVGLAQVGSGCGTGAATWTMVAASPADESMTAMVHVQSATSADEQAVQIVLATFNLIGTGSAPGSTAPGATLPGSTVPSAPAVSVPAGLGPVQVAQLFLDSLAAGDGATACALLAEEEMTINFVDDVATCAEDLAGQVAGQGEFWASVQISGDENTSSPGQCGDEDVGDDYVSLELQGPSDVGCLSIGQEADGEWRIEDLSNSIWNQAPA
jgi:hypothetical protein